MVADCKELVADEIRDLTSHVTEALGSTKRAKRAVAAITVAAKEISCFSGTLEQRNFLRDMVAHLIGYRLSRLDREETKMKEHYALHSEARNGLEKQGIAAKYLNELSTAVTGQLAG